MQCRCVLPQRQTAIILPLDWIGQSLDEMQRKDFINSHKCKKSFVEYTPWIKPKTDFDNS